VLLESIEYCQKNKGLEVFGWCIMTSHVHLIIGTSDKKIEDITRDLKSFTSNTLRKSITEHPQESRKEWMLWMMKRTGIKNGNNTDYQFWQQSYHPIELWDNYMMQQKLDYIHQNPVEAGFVDKPEHYIYCSARDYTGENGLLNIKIIQ
jgi:REP element-mobilizing transposase RayT